MYPLIPQPDPGFIVPQLVITGSAYGVASVTFIESEARGGMGSEKTNKSDQNHYTETTSTVGIASPLFYRIITYL